MSKPADRARTDWAEDEDDTDLSTSLPAPTVTTNPDSTETHISYRIRDDGKKVRTTRIIKRTVVKNTVNPRIAERRGWAKFGASARDGPGPQNATTSVGENIELNLRQNLGAKGGAGGAGGGGSGGGADGEGMNGEGEDGVNGGGLTEKELQKEKLKGATVKCRICNGEHFTARCPYKATMAPDGEPAAGEPAADPMAEGGGAGGVGATKGKYVAPGARAGAAGGGERMGGKYERDDLATLRVTNVSEYAEEDDLREMFGRYGRVTRVFLAKDRETGRAKGFAFVSFADRDDAGKACVKMDGFGYNNLILRVEFAKKTG